MIRGLHVKQAHEHHVNLGAQMFQDYLLREDYEHWGNLCTNISFRITSHRNFMNILLNTTRKKYGKLKKYLCNIATSQIHFQI
jgi:hypothetical protein